MNIAGRDIGPGHPPYVVAEIAGEHRQSTLRLLRLMDAAKEAGADAVKLQAFVPELLAESRGGKDKVLTEGLWAGRKLGELYTETRTERSMLWLGFDYARKIGITCFASVFHPADIDFLEGMESLDCPAYKISSFEITDLQLIRKAASTGKPLIMSTGMASRSDLHGAMIAAATSNDKIAYLHCVSEYPCPIERADLGRLVRLREQFDGHGWIVGLSDHTLGNDVAIASVALGASIIEKHLTLSRADGGPDAPFSLEPHEFKALVQSVRNVHLALQPPSQGEDTYRHLRRAS